LIDEPYEVGNSQVRF